MTAKTSIEETTKPSGNAVMFITSMKDDKEALCEYVFTLVSIVNVGLDMKVVRSRRYICGRVQTNSTCCLSEDITSAATAMNIFYTYIMNIFFN